MRDLPHSPILSSMNIQTCLPPGQQTLHSNIVPGNCHKTHRSGLWSIVIISPSFTIRCSLGKSFLAKVWPRFRVSKHGINNDELKKHCMNLRSRLRHPRFSSLPTCWSIVWSNLVHHPPWTSSRVLREAYLNYLFLLFCSTDFGGD